ncbi:hypothetical protein [Microbacterium aurum]
MHRGRLDEGLEWLGRAIDTIPDDPLAVANLRMNRSLVAMQRGQLAAATADLEAAVAAYVERHGDPVEVAEARHNLGYTALLGGDLVRAMREKWARRVPSSRPPPPPTPRSAASTWPKRCGRRAW